MTSGFFYHIARYGTQGYRTVKNPLTVAVHPSSALAKLVYYRPDEVEEKGDSKPADDSDETPLHPPECVVYYELAFTTREFMRQVW